jgi:hypothetical protein
MADEETTGEVNGLRLTFAELDMLLSANDNWPRVRAWLSFPEGLDQDTAQVSGLASLLARELVELSGEDVMMGEALAELVRRVGGAAVFVRVETLERAAASMASDVTTLVADADGGARLMIHDLAPGLVELVPWVDAPAFAEQAEAMIAYTLERTEGVTVVVAGDESLLFLHSEEAWGHGDPDGPAENYKLVAKDRVLGVLHEFVARSVKV